MFPKELISPWPLATDRTPFLATGNETGNDTLEGLRIAAATLLLEDDIDDACRVNGKLLTVLLFVDSDVDTRVGYEVMTPSSDRFDT